jgi:hypothetical protein
MERQVGPIFSGARLKQAALDTLQTWAETYYAAAEDQHGLTPRTLELPSWRRPSSDKVDTWPEDALPCVFVGVAGLAGDPKKTAATYGAPFALSVAAVVRGVDEDDAEDTAQITIAALRTVILHHKTLGGAATDLQWIDEEYDLVARNRTRAVAQSTFAVWVDGVSNTRGPTGTPPEDPYTDPPGDIAFETVDVTVTPTEEPSSP